MKKTIKKIGVSILVLSMILSPCCSSKVFAAKKTKKIILNAKQKTLSVGEKYKLKVKKVKPNKASKKVKWKTNKKSVATVNSKGVVSAKNAGVAKITAISKINKKVKASCYIFVSEQSEGKTPSVVSTQPVVPTAPSNGNVTQKPDNQIVTATPLLIATPLPTEESDITETPVPTETISSEQTPTPTLTEEPKLPSKSTKTYDVLCEVTGWGGENSYPSAVGHEQGIDLPKVYQSDINCSSGYTCGLELMNPYNYVFDDSAYDFRTIIKNMKDITVIVTTKNGEDALAYNWNDELILPSGKPVRLTADFLQYQYLVFFGNDDTITSVKIYDASTIIDDVIPTEQPESTVNPSEEVQMPSEDSKIYNISCEVTGWGGEESYPSSKGHAQGTIAPSVLSTDMRCADSYICGLEVMNPYNGFFQGTEDDFTSIIKEMNNPTVMVTTQNGNDALAYNWHEELILPSGKPVKLTSDYLQYNYLGFFGNDDTIIKIQLYDSKPAETFTVTFNDYDGKVLKTEKVEKGKAATAPVIPERTGFKFLGWDKEFDNITENLVVTANYKEISTPLLIVQKIVSQAGDQEVQVSVDIKNNPGILGMILNVEYDDKTLSLEKGEIGEAVSDVLVMTPGKVLKNGCKFVFDGLNIKEDEIKDGQVLLLTFSVSETAKKGEYPISISYTNGDVIDGNLSPVALDVINGNISIQ